MSFRFWLNTYCRRCWSVCSSPSFSRHYVDDRLLAGGGIERRVRDYYQKIRHPELPDDALVSLSRKVTWALAGASLAIALTVAYLVPGRSVFWFVIFGWSGIAATFCPTIILSLFWSPMTGRGALAAMVAGFIGVPLFKFGATAIPTIGPYFDTLSELPPAFFLSFLVGVVVSLMDSNGPPHNADTDLRFAKQCETSSCDPDATNRAFPAGPAHNNERK